MREDERQLLKEQIIAESERCPVWQCSEPNADTTVGVETKIRMGLLLHFSDGLRKLGEVLHFGCEKHGAPKTGRANDPTARDAIVDSLMRHLTAPERCDPESGLPHSWHVLANALFLAEKDDR